MPTSKIIFILLRLCLGNPAPSEYGYVIDEIDGNLIRVESEGGVAFCVSPELSRIVSEGEIYDASGNLVPRSDFDRRHRRRIAELQEKSMPMPDDL